MGEALLLLTLCMNTGRYVVTCYWNLDSYLKEDVFSRSHVLETTNMSATPSALGHCEEVVEPAVISRT